MTRTRPVVTALSILLNLWLVGATFSLPEVELSPEDVPSFYWAQQRFGRVSIETPDGVVVEENAIAEWKALNDLRQMRVWVSDLWPRLSYDDRYSLVRGLGDIAARKGYSLMVVDLGNTVLATYECRSGEQSEENELPEYSLARHCDIDLNPPATTATPPPRL
ncbi:MAG: hypothetical protein AB4050_11040 [Synechococcus sp.]